MRIIVETEGGQHEPAFRAVQAALRGAGFAATETYYRGRYIQQVWVPVVRSEHGRPQSLELETAGDRLRRVMGSAAELTPASGTETRGRVRRAAGALTACRVSDTMNAGGKDV